MVALKKSLNVKDRKYYIFVFLLWCALFITPRVFFTEEVHSSLTKIRFEDFLIPLWIIYLFPRRRALLKIIGPHIWGIIWLWVLFVFLSTLVNSIVGSGYPLWVGIAFAGKELQYILYFCFFAVFAVRNRKFTIISFILPSLASYPYVLWQIYQSTYRGYYGVALPFEVGIGSSSEVGYVSAILLVFFVSITLNKKKLLADKGKWANLGIYPLIVVAFLTLLLTLSRSNIIGATAALVILILMKTLRKMLNPLYLVGPLMVVVFVTWLLQQLPPYENLKMRMMLIKDDALPYRILTWKALLDYQFDNPFAIFAGLGLGSPNFLLPGQYSSGLTLGVDSQFIRRLFEVGILGSFLWFALLVSIGIRILKNAKDTAYHSTFRDLVLGIFMTTFITSFGLEVFQVIRSASIFYALTGILLGLSFVVSKSMRTRNVPHSRTLI